MFSQTHHIQRFFKCGIPRLKDYNCFDYDTINIGYPKELEISSEYNKNEIPKKYLMRLLLRKTSAFLVIKDDKIINENYWFGFNKDSIMNSFSLAKSIVSLLIGVAIQEGKIKNINQRVDEFLPLFANHFKYNLRIIDLLSMSSGLSWREEFANPLSDVVMAYYGNNLDKLIKKLKIVNKPGEKWKYQCGNTVVLSLILEKVTGIPMTKYVEEKLWKPLGASHVAYWGKDNPDGLTKAFCCFYATPRDFAKLGLLVLHNGKYNGKQIVARSFIDAISKPASWLIYRKKNVDFYSLHFWLVKYHKRTVPYFFGLFGLYVFVFPEENAVILRFGEMINELIIQPVPPDVPLYLKIADKLIK